MDEPLPCVHCGKDAQKLAYLETRVRDLEVENHALRVDLEKAVSLLKDVTKNTTWRLEEWYFHLRTETELWLKGYLSRQSPSR